MIYVEIRFILYPGSIIFQVAKAQSLRDSLRPVIVACSKEHGVTDADIQAAKDAGSAASIPPCFIACVFKKAGFVSTQQLN